MLRAASSKEPTRLALNSDMQTECNQVVAPKHLS